MNKRLPKQFWRVVVLDGSKLKTYDRSSKTYASETHAFTALSGFLAQGIAAEIWTTGKVEWSNVM